MRSVWSSEEKPYRKGWRCSNRVHLGNNMRVGSLPSPPPVNRRWNHLQLKTAPDTQTHDSWGGDPGNCLSVCLSVWPHDMQRSSAAAAAGFVRISCLLSCKVLWARFCRLCWDVLVYLLVIILRENLFVVIQGSGGYSGISLQFLCGYISESYTSFHVRFYWL